MTKAKNRIVEWLLALVFAWALAGFISFRFRHPWATETEAFIHWFDVITFQKVPYQEMRPRT